MTQVAPQVQAEQPEVQDGELPLEVSGSQPERPASNEADQAEEGIERPQHPDQTMSDGLLLARLGIAECRGLGANRDECHYSVMSTVFTRIEHGIISDGTVYGTIDWGNSENEPQFVPWVTRGCVGIIEEACLDLQPTDWALENAYSFLAGERIPGICEGYLYYNSIDGGNDHCVIRGNGQFVEFHTTYADTLVTPTRIPDGYLIETTPTPTPDPRTEGFLLTRLGMAECSIFEAEAVRDACHYSVMSTAYARVETGYKSNGTLLGALSYDIGVRQPPFDAWITQGCNRNYSETCYDDGEVFDWAVRNAYGFLAGETAIGTCEGFLEFNRLGAVQSDQRYCIISDGENFLGFYIPAEAGPQ